MFLFKGENGTESVFEIQYGSTSPTTTTGVMKKEGKAIMLCNNVA